ncbi:toxin-antitoxin system PIN domain toxin [Granulicella rosea]|uniref:Ribonuclease VapC n=1 Tax=Granulicella rosea TaxID=474952 RepID=A0A239LKH6_9BACT|nr:TA system VapC family ribonuclease toxin [Granulicella rosea]SNT30398.1 toxin-antitoxin system PIN domain toxin [Granulicella rosea]
MNTFLFLDVSVWLALAHEVHPHHRAAVAWGESVDPSSRFYFCRFSQLSLLRLLTNASTMGDDVATQAEAWRIYDLFHANGKTFLADEPKGIEEMLRLRTSKDEVSTKEWADVYLTAFAELAGLRFVTFDKALARKTKGAILLSGR